MCAGIGCGGDTRRHWCYAGGIWIGELAVAQRTPGQGEVITLAVEGVAGPETSGASAGRRMLPPPPGLSFTSASSCRQDSFCLAGWEDMSRQFFRLSMPCWSGHCSSETSWTQPGLPKLRTCLNTTGKANGAAEATGDRACTASGTREALTRHMREGSKHPCLKAVIEPYSCRRHAGTVVVNRRLLGW